MTPGKMASQAAHASKNCLLQSAISTPEITALYQGFGFLGTQIVLKAKNEGQILRAYEEAKQAGLNTNLVIDSGHIMPPFFNGDPIVTALGIGPCTEEEARFITKRFGMVQ